MAVVQKTCEGVHVGPASPTPRNDLIILYRNIVFTIVQRRVRLDDECKGQLALLEQAVGSWHSVKC